jgi:hypothetical protein
MSGLSLSRCVIYRHAPCYDVVNMMQWVSLVSHKWYAITIEPTWNGLTLAIDDISAWKFKSMS